MKKKIIRTPMMLQMEASECGAAALGIVLGYYGGYKPLDELRQICNITRNGSNAAYVLMGAESLGLQGTGFTYSPEELVKQKAPIILHWGFNHFLVYEGYDEVKKQVYLNDPARGHRKVSWQEFEENYTGIALVLRPGSLAYFAEGIAAGKKGPLFCVESRVVPFHCEYLCAHYYPGFYG